MSMSSNKTAADDVDVDDDVDDAVGAFDGTAGSMELAVTVDNEVETKTTMSRSVAKVKIRACTTNQLAWIPVLEQETNTTPTQNLYLTVKVLLRRPSSGPHEARLNTMRINHTTS